MAAASNIVLNDGQGTPVAHTFVPARKLGTKVDWEERVSAHTANGFYTISTSANAPSTGQVVRNKITLAVPLEVYDSVTATYSYPSTARASIDVLIPVSATSAQRADVYAFAKNLLAHATIQAMIKDLDVPF